MQYDSLEQANMRLGNTVVKYDGRPVKVKGVGAARNTLDLLVLPHGRDVITVNYHDKKLDVQDLRLGYVNVNNVALYITRIPNRQQKQGLCKQNIIMKKPAVIQWDNLILMPEFCDAMRGIYPSFREVVDRLYEIEELHSMAFARRFALHRDKELGFFELLYRGQKVAWGDPDNFNLPSEHTYLTEIIQQEGLHIR